MITAAECKNAIENKNEVNSRSSVDFKTIESIKAKLLNIFDEDKKLDNPVFLFVKDNVDQKFAHYLSGHINRPLAVGIAGETASGKSTIAFDIISAILDFQEENSLEQIITRVNTDDYYYDRSELVESYGSFTEFAKHYDLDCPDAFELDLLRAHIEQLVLGKEVWLPKYDMSGTAKRYDNFTLAKPSKLIINEGMYTLNDKIKNVFDISIYVDVSCESQKERWYKRANERNLVNADEVYINAVEKAKIHVRPTAKNADIIINGEAQREDYKIIANKFIEIVKELHLESNKIAP